MKWPWMKEGKSPRSRWKPKLTDRQQLVAAGAATGMILGGGIAYRGVTAGPWYEAVALIVTGSAIIAATGITAWRLGKSEQQ